MLSSATETLIARERAMVRYGYPRWLRLVLQRDVVAITLGRRIWVKADYHGNLDALLRHELAHVRQMIDLGLPRFAWRYALEFLSGLRKGRSWNGAYAAISFEVEARRAESPGE